MQGQNGWASSLSAAAVLKGLILCMTIAYCKCAGLTQSRLFAQVLLHAPTEVPAERFPASQKHAGHCNDEYEVLQQERAMSSRLRYSLYCKPFLWSSADKMENRMCFDPVLPRSIPAFPSCMALDKSFDVSHNSNSATSSSLLSARAGKSAEANWLVCCVTRACHAAARLSNVSSACSSAFRQ